jgi:acetoin utilization deacetylase AcuC-like enzyme
LNVYYSDHFVLPLPPGHRFPMAKYRMLRDALPRDGSIVFHEAPDILNGVLALAHDPCYIAAVSNGTLSPSEQRAIGFPWSVQMVERSRRATGATIAACRAALEHGTAANLAGGTHHANHARGEGFCVFNDSAIAARLMQAERKVSKVAIVDLDVHQGNGTAAILRDDDSIFTLSIHGALNYPFTKEQSDLDVALPDSTGDEVYLSMLDDALTTMFSRTNPELIIYLSGADIHEGDRLGRLSLTKAGISARDSMVFSSAQRRGIPVAVTMGGGYGKNIDDTVAIHLQTVSIAAQFSTV